ncbi:MAG TPA: XdhC family protein [Acidobacteriaceae bacterium]|jgi:xanthine/CO dehydrogenase XdhC/CoxF family maturation factor
MMDRRRIVRQWKHGIANVLVTLVRAEGSSYRRPGAHLLIDADGEYAGTISGGCLEAEVVRKAAWMVRGGAMVERYSTLFDDTAEIPFGLGCGGVVDLLLEPADTAECRALIDAMEASLRGRESRVATWLPVSGKRLRRAVFSPNGDVIFRSAELTVDDLRAVSNSDSEIYCETLSAPLRLFVLGAGDDARPVVTMAAQLGWSVTVADGRAQLARPGRFPEAERVLAGAAVADLGVGAADAVVLMTHSYEQDRTLLTGLLGTAEVPGYIGLLGASHRSSLLVSEAAVMLGCSVAACCERVWAPVGLDLGGDGAEAIALAVVAEVHAWLQGKLASSRRLTAERVAEQVAKGGASKYLQTQCAMGS